MKHRRAPQGHSCVYVKLIDSIAAIVRAEDLHYNVFLTVCTFVILGKKTHAERIDASSSPTTPHPPTPTPAPVHSKPDCDTLWLCPVHLTSGLFFSAYV